MVAAGLSATVKAPTPSGYVVGVDLGGTKALAGAVGPDLSVRHRSHRQVFGLDQSTLVDTIVSGVEEIAAAAGEAPGAIGFGIPCLIDQRTGMAVMAVNLPLHDIAFRDVMSERLGVPVVVDNDGNCAALAEARFGAGRGTRHLAMLTIGTGIGGGLVLDGELYRGLVGAGAELGHMVIAMDGPPCQGACPNRGCLEAVASGTALVREAALAVARRPETALGQALEDGHPLTGPLITELAHDGDPVARDVITLIGRRLGVGIGNLVNMFEPEVVVIGGGVIAAGEMLLAPAREEMLARALSPSRELVRVEAAAFGAEAGMIGAALLARALVSVSAT